MKSRYLYPLSDSSVEERGGNKAKNLRYLIKRKYPVPKGFVLAYDALEEYEHGGTAVLTHIRKELLEHLHPEISYAVRSSASLEDQGDFSCAGAFESYLHVRGADEVLRKILEVWASLQSEKLMAYLAQSGLTRSSIRMAVIIQEMVHAEVSGVAFSKNPMTGFSEIILEAAVGDGESQILEKKAPERWVEKWGVWKEKPSAALLPEEVSRKLCDEVDSIAKGYGRPVDVEWAYDGKNIYYLQVRPITKLDIPVYSNKITKEMLPGVIKPLVWSVNTSFINKIWREILVSLTGDQSIDQDHLTGYFYGRAYFNMALFGQVFESMGIPYEGLELLLGLEEDGPRKPHLKPGMRALKRAPSLLKLTASFLTAEKKYWKMEERKRSRYEELAVAIEDANSPEECLVLAKEVLKETEPVTYYNIMLPMLLMMMHRILKSTLDKEGVDVRHLTLSGVEEAARKYSPHVYLAEIRKKYHLPKEMLTVGEKRALEKEIEEFLKKFGHFSDSGNDCSKKPWRETPLLIYEMLQAGGMDVKEEKITFSDLPRPVKRKLKNRVLYRRTSSLAVTRESVSSLYTFGYGQFRRIFIKLGNLMKEEGLLENEEDVYYLYFRELEDLILEHKKEDLRALVVKRKKDLLRYQDVAVPELIIGQDEPPLQEEKAGDYEGIPTSLGVYTGPARVLRGLSDYHLMTQGDVLIIPYSDVGWAPLFARAGAVISESGGILSHSSIVAREYRIPAVVSVRGALRIKDGTMVTVDGYSGKISLMNPWEEENR